MTEATREGVEHLRGQRRRSRHEQAHALADRASTLGWRLEQPDVHRRHAEEERRAVLLEPVEGLLVLEALDEAHVAPADQPALHAVAEPVHVKQRQRGEVAIRARDAPGRDQGERIGREVAVRQHRALGHTGGARGVHEGKRRRRIGSSTRTIGRRGVGVAQEGVHIPCGHRLGEVGEAIAGGDHGARSCIGHDVADLAPAVEHVDRHDDRAELDCRQPEVDDGEPVREAEGQAIARQTTPRAASTCASRLLRASSSPNVSERMRSGGADDDVGACSLDGRAGSPSPATPGSSRSRAGVSRRPRSERSYRSSSDIGSATIQPQAARRPRAGHVAPVTSPGHRVD